MLDAGVLDLQDDAATNVQVLAFLVRRRDRDLDVRLGACGGQLLELGGMLALLGGDVDGVRRSLAGPLLEVAPLTLISPTPPIRTLPVVPFAAGARASIRATAALPAERCSSSTGSALRCGAVAALRPGAVAPP
jgi:hypothetical protein